MSPRHSSVLALGLALSSLACSGDTAQEPVSAASPAPTAARSTGLRIALQANAHGDIEPCG